MSESTSARAAPVQRTAVTVAAAIAALLVVVTVALWAHYGTAVFYEMILAGLNACF